MKRSPFLILLLVCAFSLSINCHVKGQEAFQTSSREIINDLKEGTLVVRLYMNKKKEEYLEGLASSESESVREKAAKLLKDHQEDRMNYAQNVINEFQSYYSFSEVVFLPDYHMKDFMEGKNTGIFFGENGNIDDNITLEDRRGVMAIRGGRDDQIVITAMDGSELPKAFPRYPKVSFFKSLMRFARNHLKDNIISLNKRFEDFYKKTVSS